MERRSILKLGAGAAATAATAFTPAKAGTSCAPPSEDIAAANTAFYVPGYWPGAAYFGGVRAIYHVHLTRALPESYSGPVKMLTRLGIDGKVDQALFPVDGHDVDISPDGKLGFFGALEGEDYICFDPATLDVVSIGKPVADGWIGGGHGAYLHDGKVLAVSERAPKTPYSGEPEHHFGRITLRDPETLKIVETYSTHGVSPHDICLLPDGRHLAIANYGSVVPRQQTDYGLPRQVVEPSVSVIDLNDGKLVAKRTTGAGRVELRHLAAVDVENIFAIQVEMAPAEADQAQFTGRQIAYEPDFTASDEHCYLPAHLLSFRGRQKLAREIGNDDDLARMRQGIGIRHDREHEEVLVTFPSSHTLMVIDAASGDIKQRIDTAAFGLDYPCGISVIPGSPFYAVSGYWKNLFIFRRKTHELVRELCHYTAFFGHSHMTAVRTA